MKLINVIVPCYNGEKYLDRFFRSFLNQTLKNFNIYFIDDGSSDNTKLICEKYVDRFKEQGVELFYIFKQNGGAASAINVAFKQKLEGKYLFILDADDEILPNGLEKRVEFMENNPQFSACTGRYNCINNETYKLEYIINSNGICKSKKRSIKNIIFTRDCACPGYFFIKDKLFSVLNNRHIYESKSGQNWQILIPFLDKYRIGNAFNAGVQYNYYLISSSHSHSIKPDLNSKIDRINNLIDILTNTLASMQNGSKYQKFIYEFKYKELIDLAYKMRDAKMMKENMIKLFKVRKIVGLKYIIKYVLIKLKIK